MAKSTDPIQAAVEHAYANGCSLIELRVGDRSMLLLTTRRGHRLRSFEIDDVGKIIKYIDDRREMLEAQRRSLAPKVEEA